MENETTGMVIDVLERQRGAKLLELLDDTGLHWFLLSASKGNWHQVGLARPLQRVRVWLQKRGQLWRIQEGVVLDSYEGLQASYATLNSAQLMRQTIKRLARQGLACQPLHQALQAHLEALQRGLPPRRVLASFLTKALLAEGYLDSQSLPVCCHCAVGEQPLWNIAGQWHCAQHRSYDKLARSWSLSQQQLLLQLAVNRSWQGLTDPDEAGLVPLLQQWVEQLGQA